MGIWQVASLLDFFVYRWGWTWFKQDPNAWKKLNPQLSAKIEELEARIKKT